MLTYQVLTFFTFLSSVLGFQKIQISIYNDTTGNRNPFVQLGTKYYFFGENLVNWYEAAQICRSRGADLATIENVAEMDLISDYFITKGLQHENWVWLSASDLGKEGEFMSIGTGKAIPFSRWSSGQPDNWGNKEHCMHLWRIGDRMEMNDVYCTAAARYICEHTPQTVTFTMW